MTSEDKRTACPSQGRHEGEQVTVNGRTFTRCRKCRMYSFVHGVGWRKLPRGMRG